MWAAGNRTWMAAERPRRDDMVAVLEGLRVLDPQADICARFAACFIWCSFILFAFCSLAPLKSSCEVLHFGVENEELENISHILQVCVFRHTYRHTHSSFLLLILFSLSHNIWTHLLTVFFCRHVVCTPSSMSAPWPKDLAPGLWQPFFPHRKKMISSSCLKAQTNKWTWTGRAFAYAAHMSPSAPVNWVQKELQRMS